MTFCPAVLECLVLLQGAAERKRPTRFREISHQIAFGLFL